MKLKPLNRLPQIVVALFGLCSAALFAETSPWPFPSRVPSGSRPAAGPGFTIAFWNVEWFPGRRPNATPAEESSQVNAVHADIAKLGADIIGMEEVRDFAHAG